MKMSYSWVLTLVLSCLLVGLKGGLTEQCGTQAGGALCADGYCCSQYGYCGTTDEYCGDGCQSQCWSPPPPPSPTPPPPPPSPPPSGAITDIITSEVFDQLLPNRNNDLCPAKNFYTYDAFVAAANFFPGFATTGDNETRVREVAAFLAQTSHETNGGGPESTGGPYAWGYCYLKEISPVGNYCVSSVEWPCASGQSYYGRGPIQISYNYNYGPAGVALGVDLLGDPNLVETNTTISFETALWFWMTPQSPKPSCHDVMTGGWTPSAADIAAGRLPGYGVTTNIINGGLECGHGTDDRVQNRIGYFETFCQILGVSTGDNLDCGNQTSFSSGGALLDSI